MSEKIDDVDVDTTVQGSINPVIYDDIEEIEDEETYDSMLSYTGGREFFEKVLGGLDRNHSDNNSDTSSEFSSSSSESSSSSSSDESIQQSPFIVGLSEDIPQEDLSQDSPFIEVDKEINEEVQDKVDSPFIEIEDEIEDKTVSPFIEEINEDENKQITGGKKSNQVTEMKKLIRKLINTI